MTAVPLLDAHKGKHCTARPERLSFFRRIVAAVRRKPDLVGRAWTPGAAPTTLLGAEPVMRDRWVHDVRTETDARRAARHADAMHAGYANAVDRLRLEAGLPTVEQMHAMRAGSPPWLFPPLERPPWAEPVPRGPVHDTRTDVFAPHYAPNVPAPVYGQAPVARVLEAERLAAYRNGWQ